MNQRVKSALEFAKNLAVTIWHAPGVEPEVSRLAIVILTRVGVSAGGAALVYSIGRALADQVTS